MKFINQTKLDKICNTLPKWDDFLGWKILGISSWYTDKDL